MPYLSVYVCRVLIGASNPMLCSIDVLRPDTISETNEAVQRQLQAKPLDQQPWFKSGCS